MPFKYLVWHSGLGLGLGWQSGHCWTRFRFRFRDTKWSPFNWIGRSHTSSSQHCNDSFKTQCEEGGGVVTWQYSNLPIPWNLYFRLQHVRCASSLIQNYDFESFVAANEHMPSYGPDSPERKQLYEALNKYKDTTTDIPIVIGDEEFRTKDVRYQVMVKAIISLLIKSTFFCKKILKNPTEFWNSDIFKIIILWVGF